MEYFKNEKTRKTSFYAVQGRDAFFNESLADQSKQALWVPVNERLPNISDGKFFSEQVLIFDSDKTLWFCYLTGHGKWFDNEGQTFYPTHWMENPELPKL